MWFETFQILMYELQSIWRPVLRLCSLHNQNPLEYIWNFMTLFYTQCALCLHTYDIKLIFHAQASSYESLASHISWCARGRGIQNWQEVQLSQAYFWATFTNLHQRYVVHTLKSVMVFKVLKNKAENDV